jgi:hypothetical protein
LLCFVQLSVSLCVFGSTSSIQKRHLLSVLFLLYTLFKVDFLAPSLISTRKRYPRSHWLLLQLLTMVTRPMYFFFILVQGNKDAKLHFLYFLHQTSFFFYIWASIFILKYIRLGIYSKLSVILMLISIFSLMRIISYNVNGIRQQLPRFFRKFATNLM